MNFPVVLHTVSTVLLFSALSTVLIGGDDRQPAPPIRTQPAQPTIGPGGSQYAHGSVRKLGLIGSGATAYYLYEPADPAPATAPVVVFMHGYVGVKPALYGNWIEHLVRHGYTVLFPLYQTGLLGGEGFTANAMAAVKDGFRRLDREPGHVRPDPKRRWALVGHSLGCVISANIATQAKREGLSTPRALMLTTPGDGNHTLEKFPSILESPQDIPDLLMLIVVADSDAIVGEACGRRIFVGATGVASIHKNLIRLRSDRTGRPPLSGYHFSPLAWNGSYEAPETTNLSIRLIELEVTKNLMQTDACDYFGYWKWCDGLLESAFGGQHREFALGNTPEQKFMGRWSDGTAIKEADVETFSPTIQTSRQVSESAGR